MSGGLMKWCLLLSFFMALIACDDDKVTGNTRKEDCEESNNPNCYKTIPGVSPISGDYDYKSYDDGDVVTFQWDQTLAWFLQSENHQYGYDRDPFSNLEDYVERGKDVYMSVLKGEMAKVKIAVDQYSKKIYRVHRINEDKEILEKNIIVGTDVCQEKSCVKEYALPVGHYAVFYDELDKKRYLHIIEYSKKTNDIYFVQLGDEYGNTCNIGNANGCYSKKSVQENYNRVMAQVVTEGNFIEVDPTKMNLETAGPNNILIVDLNSTKDSKLSLVNQIYDKILASKEFGYGNEEAKYNEIKEKYANGEVDVSLFNYAVEAYNSAVLRHRQKRVVLAINEMRIRWKFLIGNDFSLGNLSAFERACAVDEDVCQSGSLTMTLESSCGDKDIPIKLSVAKTKDNDRFIPKISGFGTLKNDCEYSVYADVYPFVPDDPNAAQITITNYSSEKDKTVIGGMVWGSHLNGAASLNTIVHEIGHSFGLTDLYKDSNDPSNAPERYYYFAFNEGNIMASYVPSGDRLRYRPLFVVNTGTNDRILLGNGWYATENQWDCVRSTSKCYKK